MSLTFASVIDDAKAVYLSAPLTTGRRYRAAELGRGEQGVHSPRNSSAHESPIAQNRERARTVAKRLREELGTTIIDPTALPDIEGWNQQDYHVFWEQVIRQYVGTVVFLNDWQYSNGCAYEFLISQRGSIPCLDERLSPISLSNGLDLIRQACLDCSQSTSPRSKLELIVSELDQLSNQEDNQHALN